MGARADGNGRRWVTRFLQKGSKKMFALGHTNSNSMHRVGNLDPKWTQRFHPVLLFEPVWNFLEFSGRHFGSFWRLLDSRGGGGLLALPWLESKQNVMCNAYLNGALDLDSNCIHI